jgi:aldehyde dehydrogenase (NAD+)
VKTVSQHFINGRFVDSHGQDTVDVHNPATGELIGRSTLGDEVDTERAIASAKAASPHGPRQPRRPLTIGDPQAPETVIQPMVSQGHYERVQSYIRKGIEEGAEILVGGEGKPEGYEAGNYVKPTVFVGVTNDMAIAQEEIFGPVLSVITYRDDEEAVAIANDVEYGLHAYVYGENQERARAVADRILAGRVMINEIVDDPTRPFGGFKMSGFGREFGIHGLNAYLEIRTVFAN